tara:strand:- start:31150 stop:31365 length:216 start_codon:yes stop_codon:yes gene_type:complete
MGEHSQGEETDMTKPVSFPICIDGKQVQVTEASVIYYGPVFCDDSQYRRLRGQKPYERQPVEWIKDPEIDQ